MQRRHSTCLTAGLTEIDPGSRSHLGIGKSGTGQGNPDPQGPATAGTADGQNWAVNSQLYDPRNGSCVVNPGELVFIRYSNGSKLFRPMHLHEHTFQIVLRQSAGPQEPVLVAPLRAVDIDVETGNLGRWITHCHNTYHLESGWRCH
jgi:FtsP/CotA-like multicopper oxidase with cupredoxin domain